MGLFVCEARDMFDTTSQGSRLTLSHCPRDDRTLDWNEWLGFWEQCLSNTNFLKKRKSYFSPINGSHTNK